MLTNVARLRERWTEVRQAFGHDTRPLEEKRTKASLDKEQSWRWRDAYRRKEQQVMNGLTPSAQSALGMTPGDTSIYEGPLAQMFSGGSFGQKGRITPKSAFANPGGEYNGAAGIPPIFFGGGLSVGNAADEAHNAGYIADGYPDTLWDAIRKEVQTQSRNKAALAAAMATLKAGQQQAMAEAKQEAADWRARMDAMQAKDWNPQTVMVRMLRTLDAILSALPPEIRGKVGGWINIAELKDPLAMGKELDKRLALADEHLESWLAKQAVEDIAELLKKARPKRLAGEKPTGRLGADAHRFFDNVELVFKLSPAAVQKAEDDLIKNETDGMLNDAGVRVPMTDEQLLENWSLQMILEQFGGLAWAGRKKAITGHDAAHAVEALDKLETVYVEARDQWKMMEEMRMAKVNSDARQVVDFYGGESYQAIQRQKKEETKKSDMAGKWNWEFKSFRGFMDTLLPGFQIAVDHVRMAREGMALRNDEVAQAQREWVTASEVATGKRGLEAQRAVFELGNPANQKVVVNTAGKGTRQNQQIPTDIIVQWKAGTADPKALNITRAEADQLIAEMDAMDPADDRKALTLKRVIRDSPESVPMTEAEGITLTLLYAQEKYRSNLDLAGWDAAAIQQIEDQLSPASKSLRGHMAAKYADGYGPLAKVYERMFGVGFSQIKNYSPGIFYNLGANKPSRPGDGTVEGGFRAGFLKTRKEHDAEPRLENAFDVYFGHVNQMAHWKNMAEPVRHFKGVYGRPDVKKAIEGAHGEAAYSALINWINALEANGIQQTVLAANKTIRWLTTSASYIGLALNFGTLMKQSSAVLGAAYKMPALDYMKGFAKLFGAAGGLEMSRSEIAQSPLIQRRLVSGFSPEVRAAMADLWSAKPSRRMAVLDWSMDKIGSVDAYFTAASAAIAYDYHYHQAIKAGMTKADAQEEAMQMATDIVGETAQPADVVDRSLIELSMSPMAKLLFLFSSEARQKSAHTIKAWGGAIKSIKQGKAPSADDIKVIILSHLILGPAMAFISAMWRDMRDDDDDEWFDDKNWNLMDYTRASLLGPLAGIPLIRDLVSTYNDPGILGSIPKGKDAVIEAIKGPDGKQANEPLEFYVEKVAQALQASLLPAPAVAGKTAKQIFDVADNLFNDSWEQAVKDAKKKDKEDGEAKAEAEAEVEGLTPAEKEENRRAKIEAKAEAWRADHPHE
jgi:hypothetical protein